MIFSLDEELIFPHPILRDSDGLLTVGGDLSATRLLLAYRWGIFPWYHDDQPILWWWTSPRLMLKPENVHVSHSVRNTLNKNRFRITFDHNFPEVIKRCAINPRIAQEGTWILPEMIRSYSELYHLGYAHSVEVYDENELTGGLYGIALGNIFFGESMFTEKANASKIGFIHLCRHLQSKGFEWIDCQQDTPHMRTMGAYLVSEDDFLQILRANQIHMLKEKRSNFF